jgi:hypothetical protein
VGHEVERHDFVPTFVICIHVMPEAGMEGAFDLFHIPLDAA